ncbi:hypothetical protein MDA_GLEAN10006212 [Myotis davidii]|uniref:Uncharacterized protein n=1 Tax=Myotis davidii TaxID=225400 RepID=L5M5J0_MYODS|nr:hypothetical protein MDA_GLEAN10006212 [Myotis davidii]
MGKKGAVWSYCKELLGQKSKRTYRHSLWGSGRNWQSNTACHSGLLLLLIPTRLRLLLHRLIREKGYFSVQWIHLKRATTSEIDDITYKLRHKATSSRLWGGLDVIAQQLPFPAHSSSWNRSTL